MGHFTLQLVILHICLLTYLVTQNADVYMILRAKGISHNAMLDACADHVGHNVCGHLQWKIATHVVPYMVCKS